MEPEALTEEHEGSLWSWSLTFVRPQKTKTKNKK